MLLIKARTCPPQIIFLYVRCWLVTHSKKPNAEFVQNQIPSELPSPFCVHEGQCMCLICFLAWHARHFMKSSKKNCKLSIVSPSAMPTFRSIQLSKLLSFSVI